MKNKIIANKIFILCPANNKTGGTELLHQLANELNCIGKDAYIVYYYEGKTLKNNPTPEEFKKYNIKVCKMNEINDSVDNLLILPEVCIGKHRKFKKIQKAIWWLSVDNYLVMEGKWNRLKKYGVLSFFKHVFLNDFFGEKDIKNIENHLYQSYFAADFLLRKGIKKENMYYLSDYINDIYIKEFDRKIKEDIVIFNPKKGYQYTLKLINNNKSLKWIPIQNMTNDEVQLLMLKAKVYIDFGNHPGKDRIPREAAMSGCCIFTNKRGSAAFSKDVPILEKYKYEDIDANIPIILKEIEKCIKNYSKCIDDFKGYRDFIGKEKEKFKEDVLEIFG